MRRLMTVFIGLASLGLLVLLLIVRIGTWTPRWWLDSLDTFALYAFGPFVGTVVAALLLRSRLLSVIGVCAVALFAQQFGVQTIGSFDASRPPAAEASPSSSNLRVLTLNVHASYDDPEPLLGLLAQRQPDVVVLQEVSSHFASAVKATIGAEYAFSYTIGLDTDHEGSATWSRLPLSGGQPIVLTHDANFQHRVRVSTTAGGIWVYNIHLSNPTGQDHGEGRLSALRRFNPDERDMEIRRLAGRTESLDAPFILAGDFNTAAGSRAYRDFPDTWRDAFAESGRGFGHTYPAPLHEREGDDWLKIPFPLLRIDYILTSRDLQPHRSWTQEVPGSDHFAVIADIELPAP